MVIDAVIPRIVIRRGVWGRSFTGVYPHPLRSLRPYSGAALLCALSGLCVSVLGLVPYSDKSRTRPIGYHSALTDHQARTSGPVSQAIPHALDRHRRARAARGT